MSKINNATNSPWEEVMEEDAKAKGKAEFTKFAEGLTNIRVLGEAPHVRWTHWMGQHKRSINCPGYSCPICTIRRAQKAEKEEYTINMAKRFSINIINLSTGNVEILDQGRTFFDELLEFNKEQDIREYDLKVRRKGMDTTTTYRIDKEKDRPLSEEEVKLAEKDTIDLKEYLKEHTIEQIQRVLDGEAWNDVMGGEEEQDKAQEKEKVTV